MDQENTEKNPASTNQSVAHAQKQKIVLLNRKAKNFTVVEGRKDKRKKGNKDGRKGKDRKENGRE